MNLLQKLYQSFTDNAFYHHVASSSFKSAFSYSLGWYLLGSLVIGTAINAFYAPGIFQTTNDITAHIKTKIPPSLIIHIDNTNLSIEGSSTPLIISLPTPLNDELQNILVIDPQASGEAIPSYQTLILFTQTSAALNNPTLETPQVFSWDQLVAANTQITYDQIINLLQDIIKTLEKIYRYRWFITPVLLFTFIFPLRLITIFFDTILISLTANLLRRPLGYKNTLKLSLHTLVSAEIIVFLLRLIYTNLPGIVFTLAFFGLSLIAVLSLPPLTLSPKNNGSNQSGK